MKIFSGFVYITRKLIYYFYDQGNLIDFGKLYWVEKWVKHQLTHFMPLVCFYNSKNIENLMFPGGIERYQWHDMGQQPRQVCPLLVSKILSRKEIHAQSHQQKHYKKVRNEFKVNNKDNKMSLASFWCLCC